MTTLIAILKVLRKQGMTVGELHDHMTWLIDNGTSEYFELSSSQLARVTAAWQDEKQYEAALSLWESL